MPRTWEPNASIDVFSESRASHVVEDTVYAATRVDDEVTLPDSVDVLTTADGSTQSVPVEWDPVPDDATDTAGRLTVHGSTEHGPVTAVVDVVETYAGLDCDRVITGRHAGPLRADGAAAVVSCDSRISGPVTSSGTSSVTIGNPVLGYAPNTITGPVTVTGTHWWNVIAGKRTARISGRLVLSDVQEETDVVTRAWCQTPCGR